jgi:hypothetical protein
MNKIELDTIIIRNNTIVASSIGDDIVMISIEKGKYYNMAAIGSRIWDLIKDDISARTVCNQLCREFDVSPEQCQTDVLNLLNDLADENLILVR